MKKNILFGLQFVGGLLTMTVPVLYLTGVLRDEDVEQIPFFEN